MDDEKYWKKFYEGDTKPMTEEKPPIREAATKALVTKSAQGNFYAVVLVGPLDCPVKAQTTASALKLFNEAPSI